MTLGLVQGRSHQAVHRWNITGFILAALEPFLLSRSEDGMTLWDRQQGIVVQKVTVEGPVLSVIAALRKIKGQSEAFCSMP